MNETKLVMPGYLRALAIILLIITIIFVMIAGRSILIPIFISGLIAILLMPVAIFLESKRVNRIISSLISLLLGIVIIFGTLTFIILQVISFSKDLGDTGDRLNTYLSDIDSFLFENFGVESGIGAGLDQQSLISIIESNSRNVAEFLFNTIGSMAGVILIPAFIFFFLLYRDHLSDFIATLFQKQDNGEVQAKIKDLRKVIQSYIIGVCKVMAILAVINTGVLFGLGIKHAIFFGVFAGLLNIIPYLGPFLGAILPTIFAFLTKDSLFYPLAVVVSFIIIQMIESNFLTPKIVGSNVNLNAFVTFVGLLIGAAIWGVIGMIIIIPTFAILKKLFELDESTYAFALLLGEERDDRNQNIPTDSDYDNVTADDGSSV